MGRRVRRALFFVLLLSIFLCENMKIHGKESEAQARTGKEFRRFRITYPEADGDNGYYRSCPEVEITHVEERGNTRYRFVNGEGTCFSGKAEAGETVLLHTPQMREGKNLLDVWMEDEKGNLIDAAGFPSVSHYEFWFDGSPPRIRASAPCGFGCWYREEAAVCAEGTDGEAGSGVREITCYEGEKKIGSFLGAKGIFHVRSASEQERPVNLTIVARDAAGNESREERTVYIDRNPPKVSISEVENYLITGAAAAGAYQAEEENGVAALEARAVRTSPDGRRTEIPAGEWRTESGRHTSRWEFEEEGMYRLEIKAADKAGHQSICRRQFMIDKSRPRILGVKDMDGKVLSEFCWNDKKSEIVQDLTICSLEIRLDGKIYVMGRTVRQEGRHHLAVRAEDEAGNVSVESADFVISRAQSGLRSDSSQAYAEKRSPKWEDAG